MISFHEYKTIVQAGKRNKPFALMRFGYLVHRDISAPISYAIVRWLPNISPNQISVVMILIGLIGSWLLLPVTTPFLGLAFVYFSFILDKVDGEVARFTQVESLRGAYLDEVYHNLVPVTFVACYFMPRISHFNDLNIWLLLMVVFLTVFRRFERKWYITIATKKSHSLDVGTIKSKSSKPFIQWFFNTFLWRATAIVERFDILLLMVLGIELHYQFFGPSYTQEFLVGYALVSGLYALRWLALNYFGNLDRQIEELRVNGF